MTTMSTNSNINSDNFYEVLGIQTNAKKSEISKAYHRVALKYHPDKNLGNPNATKIFTHIYKAYETLIDEKTRLEYDRKRNATNYREILDSKMGEKQKHFKEKLDKAEKDSSYKLSKSSLYKLNEETSRRSVQEEIARLRSYFSTSDSIHESKSDSTLTGKDNFETKILEKLKNKIGKK